MAELSMLVKATVVLILALLAAWLGSRQSAAVRSLILACAFGLLLLVPVASLMLPVRAIELPATYSLPVAREPFTAAAPVASSRVAADIAQGPPSRFGMPSLRAALLMLWAVGATAFIAPLMVDRTGLSGAYQVIAKWNAAPGSREIFEAFPAQLGLRFRDATGPVEYLVIDHVEQPTLDAR